MVEMPDLKAYALHGETEQVLLAARERANSDDPLAACEARSAEVLARMMTEWLDDEFQRGTEPKHIIRASVGLGLSTIATTASSIARTDAAAVEIMNKLRDRVINTFDNCVKKLEEVAAEGKERR